MQGFIDLQVNGYGGVDFNADNLKDADLHRACEMLRKDGVHAILATVITERLDLMESRIARLKALCDQDTLVRNVIVGIHVEGPFLNETEGYRGAHPADAIRPASTEAAARILGAGGGAIRLVTLAPERDSGARVTRFLSERDVQVAAGHSDASLDDLDRAIDNGLTLYTHLGNGCPMIMPRHDMKDRNTNTGAAISASKDIFGSTL
jgi:N-acetylglucosamine-6-phosphate deacetylase